MNSTSTANVTTNSTESPMPGLCSSGYEPAPAVLPLAAKVISGIVLAILILITILGNILVIVACLKFRQLRTKITNYFIVSLAFADLTVGLFVMGPAAVQDLSGEWPFGHFCPVWVSLDVMCSTASILNLCCISIERYIAITRPFHYPEIMTSKTAAVMLVIVWLISAGVSFGPIFAEAYYVDGERHVYETAVDPAGAYCKPSFAGTYAVISSSISFWIPSIAMTVAYAIILKIAWGQAKKVAAQEVAIAHIRMQQNKGKPVPNKKQENKALKTMIVVMGVFLFCWIPFFIVNCSMAWPSTVEVFLCKPGFIDFFLFCVWLGWINSVFNPFIYSLNPQFRRAYEKVLCCGKVYTKDDSAYTYDTS